MSQDERVEPVWLGETIAIAIHNRQLAEHGGGEGVRDQGMLEAALIRPVNRWHHGEQDMAALAAAYAFGLVKKHPFIDGNKLTGWVLARLFLMASDVELQFDKIEATQAVLDLAAGEMSEEEFAGWLRGAIV